MSLAKSLRQITNLKSFENDQQWFNENLERLLTPLKRYAKGGKSSYIIRSGSDIRPENELFLRAERVVDFIDMMRLGEYEFDVHYYKDEETEEEFIELKW